MVSTVYSPGAACSIVVHKQEARTQWSSVACRRPSRDMLTTKPLVLSDVTDSITFSTASLKHFTSVTCALGEAALISEMLSGRPANSGILWQLPLGSTVVGSEHRAC